MEKRAPPSEVRKRDETIPAVRPTAARRQTRLPRVLQRAQRGSRMEQPNRQFSKVHPTGNSVTPIVERLDERFRERRTQCLR